MQYVTGTLFGFGLSESAGLTSLADIHKWIQILTLLDEVVSQKFHSYATVLWDRELRCLLMEIGTNI